MCFIFFLGAGFSFCYFALILFLLFFLLVAPGRKQLCKALDTSKRADIADDGFNNLEEKSNSAPGTIPLGITGTF